MPNRFLANSAVGVCCQAYKWLDNAFAELNLEVDMRELYQAGQAGMSQFLARLTICFALTRRLPHFKWA